MLCHFAKCHILLIVMMNVVMLSVIILSVVMLSVTAPLQFVKVFNGFDNIGGFDDNPPPKKKKKVSENFATFQIFENLGPHLGAKPFKTFWSKVTP